MTGGKAAWQDREFGHELDRRESICIPSEVHSSSKLRQKEAHRRWVRKNRIQDLSLGEHSSDDEDFLYGVQNGAANLLLYVGLGTMCVGMVISFVGIGEKGFKTMELRLIGPSLICAGILIIILRVLLCVCPSKCLQLKKQKHKLKNSTNKLNSEGNGESQTPGDGQATEDKSGTKTSKTTYKKRVSIAMLPTTSGLSTNPSNSSSRNFKVAKGGPQQQQQQQQHQPRQQYPLVPLEPTVVSPTTSFVEREKPSSSRSWKKSPTGEPEPEMNFELRELTRRSELDEVSYGSRGSCGQHRAISPKSTLTTPDVSDVSVTSGAYEFPPLTEQETKFEKPRPSSSKYETVRCPKNLTATELVLTPSALNDVAETD
ncbi:hypothetical protein RUM43_004837 [Polyplax serrata]|uniref:Uncharacterized protein n=1 Tax=Polyplax serrata TaxID=468196 RepID=A0AAN8XQM4_POLSC